MQITQRIPKMLLESSFALAAAACAGSSEACNAGDAGDASDELAAEAAQPEADADARTEAGAYDVSWSYSGPTGPAAWGELAPAYATCGTGTMQSPVDLPAQVDHTGEPLAFEYRDAPLRVLDNGHTVQVTYAEGSFLVVDGERFELQQIHFHHPAEHAIAGQATTLSAHLVHAKESGALAVVEVRLAAGNSAQPFLDTVWQHLPARAGQTTAPAGVRIDAAALLPEDRAYYRYQGSLTTPPCTEGVLWLVLAKPVPITPEQAQVFRARYPNSARPVQPLHERMVTRGL